MVPPREHHPSFEATSTLGPSTDAPRDPLEVLRQLQSRAEGLKAGEVRARLERYGPNALPEKRVNPLLRFFQAFWGPIAWMMEIAAILSALVGDWTDFAIILVLLVVNSVVGFWEEHSAGNAVAALKSQLAPKATVLRDGQWGQVESSALVPGDVVTLKLGGVVPADGVLLGEEQLDIDQAALTGESLPVERCKGQSVFSGSIVKRGEGKAVITATGAHTFFGRTARLLSETSTVSEFQRSFLQLVNVLIGLALGLVLIVFFTQLVKADLAHQNLWQEILRSIKFLLVLIVASIPIAAPVVLSLTMAVGATRLAKEKAIVQRLSSIDELAGIDMLCSDKTGTLTLNQLSMGDPKLFSGTTAEGAILAAALASSQQSPDVIDAVVLGQLRDPAELKGYTVSHYTPFDPVSKRTEATVRDSQGKTFQVSKGAPQVILDLTASTDPEVAKQGQQQVEALAARGIRALGVARAEEGGAWTLLAILSISDPPRPDSKATLEELRGLGVGVKMLTGDQVVIAKETARLLGLGTNILDAAEVRNPKGGPQSLEGVVAGADGFGQVFPEDKYAVVSSLQGAGYLVGMTGDGVNDAPALKKANVGIAVAGATDAARSAAAVVLTAPGLSVVARAVRLSRLIFARMNAYLIYRITATIWILLFTSLCILLFKEHLKNPLKSLQI
ncbi:MAG: plasma-membrane proton-efflux P-type ATPase [Cyanobacteriota bacterium]|nr:plasma-membrane proton-efflux P-type ATPase [Cyanobacteriota bacterium]